ncbi:MAG TPA: hypothetical protein VKB19_17810 [Pedobacter sp.]|nr:hypothetical protein [Pedobacter sp.]
MKELSLRLVGGLKKEHTLFGLLLLLWGLSPELVRLADATAGYIDQSIWILVLLSLISFLMAVGLCWWLLGRFWRAMDLPLVGHMVLFCFVCFIAACGGRVLGSGVLADERERLVIFKLV